MTTLYLFKSLENMKDTILSFTLNGKKQTFLRRLDAFGEPIVTNIRQMARKFNMHDIPSILGKLFRKYGKDNVKDIKPIRER